MIQQRYQEMSTEALKQIKQYGGAMTIDALADALAIGPTLTRRIVDGLKVEGYARTQIAPSGKLEVSAQTESEERFYVAPDGYNGHYACVLDRDTAGHAPFVSCEPENAEFVCAALNAQWKRHLQSDIG